MNMKSNGSNGKNDETQALIQSIDYSDKDNTFLSNVLDDETKIEIIEDRFRDIMSVLGLNLSNDSLKDTPRRVAKMFVKEAFSGLNLDNKPKISLFKKEYNANQMIVEKDITIYSYCEHHFVPIVGRAYVAYFANEFVIGLSKLNRIVQFYAKRPQLQERLTHQISEELKRILKTKDVAVVIEADHLCIKSRGIEDVNSRTLTSEYNGRFLEPEIRNEFISYIKK